MVRTENEIRINVNKDGFVNFDRIDEPDDISYRAIYGGRSRGKTFQGKARLIECAANGRKFVYIRRKHTMIVEKKMQVLFGDINQIAEQYLGGTIEYSARKGFYVLKADGSTVHVGDAYAVEDAFDVKGITSPYEIGLFDEFLDYGYIEDEEGKFLHLMSTLSRNGTTPLRTVYMCANSVTGGKDSPYFRLFGYDWKKAKPGEICLLTHRNGVTAVFEYDKIVKAERAKKRDKFIGFDNSEAVNMIMFGEWEAPSVNIKGLEGITWKDDRYRMPYVIQTAGMYFEISYTPGLHKVLFIRRIDVQGQLGEWVRVCFTTSMRGQGVKTIRGPVAFYRRIIPDVPEDLREKWDLMKHLIAAGRVVYDSANTAGDVLTAIETISRN